MTCVASRVKQVKGWVISLCWKWQNDTISTSPIKRVQSFYLLDTENNDGIKWVKALLDM